MTPHAKERLRQQLIRDEGVRLFPYLDTVGKVTIGVGRNLTDRGISSETAMAWLEEDIAMARDDVYIALPWVPLLDEVRQAVFINLAFNMGREGLLTFQKMLTAAEAGDWTTAAQELRDSHYHQQVGERARRLATQLVTGAWQ